MKRLVPDYADRFAHGTGPQPSALTSRELEVTSCPGCGHLVRTDWRGALHKCDPPKAGAR